MMKNGERVCDKRINGGITKQQKKKFARRSQKISLLKMICYTKKSLNGKLKRKENLFCLYNLKNAVYAC